MKGFIFQKQPYKGFYLNKDLTIFSITSKYISVITDLEKKCFLDAWNEKEIREECTKANRFSFILLVKNSLCGYLFSDLSHDFISINKICVHPDERKKGYGKVLLNHLVNSGQLLGIQQFFLEVRITNTAAIRFYNNYGFNKNRVRNKIYTNGEDCLEMMLFSHLPK